jgi:hypothetical protein
MNEFVVELRIAGGAALDVWEDIEKHVPGAQVVLVKHLREPGEAGQLPIILINGKKYFEDERLQQYRSVAQCGEEIEFIDFP